MHHEDPHHVGVGPSPVCADIDGLLPDVLDGTIEPGRVFDRILPLRDTAEGYRAMDAREALTVPIQP